MQPLVADGGEMTVLRSLASHAWGDWSVEWPDSVPEAERPVLDDEDRSLGFVHRMGRGTGRMGRRFTREDVSIEAADYGPDGVPLPYSGFSDVEAALDNAATRTDGDAFFEREITRQGLGPNEPYTDFGVGDLVPVSIWGKITEQQVTSIEAVTEAGAIVDWRVHVGGQLLTDDVARQSENLEIERAIAQERRERQLGDAKEASRRNTAIQRESETREAAVQAIRDTLGGEGSSELDLFSQLATLNEQLQAQGVEPKQGLLPAYLDANVRLWEQQREIDAAQDAVQQAQEERSELIEEFVSANRDLVNDQFHTTWNIAVVPGGSDWTKNRGDVTATGSWEGEAFAIGYWTEGYSVRADGTTYRYTVSRTDFRSMRVSVDRTMNFNSRLSKAMVFYRKQSANLQTADELVESQLLPSGDWVTLREFTAPTDADYLLSLKVRWATTRFAGHDIRIRVGDQVIAEKYGTGTLEILRPSVPLSEGQTVRFEAHAINLLPGERDIRDGLTRVSWKEEE